MVGLDAHVKVVGLAEAMPASTWKRLERLPNYEILTEPRQKAIRHEAQIVIRSGECRCQMFVEGK
jgi:hypothetical protein